MSCSSDSNHSIKVLSGASGYGAEGCNHDEVEYVSSIFMIDSECMDFGGDDGHDDDWDDSNATEHVDGYDFHSLQCYVDETGELLMSLNQYCSEGCEECHNVMV